MAQTYPMMEHSTPPASSATQATYDALLVTLLVAGDRRAGDRLHARWNPRLLRTARRLTGDGEMAVAVVQDCWVAILRGLPRLRDAERFGPWAFSILRRRCADGIARKSSDRAASGDSEPPDLPASPTQFDALSMQQAFAMLTPDHRLAAHLHFVEGFTLAEIAEVQDVPLGTAKSRLFHARQQLKAALSDKEPGVTP